MRDYRVNYMSGDYSMANIKSAKKRAIQSESARKRNSSKRSKIRTFIKKTRIAIEKGDASLAKHSFSQMQPIIDRSVADGLIHKNKASRHKSRLISKINRL